MTDPSDEVLEVLRQGVNLLRTTYASSSDFAYEAQMWVLSAEHVLEQSDGSAA